MWYKFLTILSEAADCCTHILHKTKTICLHLCSGTWDDIMVKSLIDIVGKKKGARDGKDTDIAWTKVADNHAEQLKHTAEQCRNKWNKLRELYHIVLKYDNQTGKVCCYVLRHNCSC